MKAFILALFMGLGLTSAQGVRSLGMGGLMLPGPDAAVFNPAYAAYPGAKEELRLPFGLVSLVVNPQTNVFNYFLNKPLFDSEFDYLALYDQLLYLDSYLINPPEAPDDVKFSIGPGGIVITDGQGNSLPLNFDRPASSSPSSIVAAPLFALPIPLPLPGFSASVGLFTSADRIGLTPSNSLRLALAGAPIEADTLYSLTAAGNVKAGLSGQFSYALAFPDFGLGRLYAGARGEAFYGLAYLEAKAIASSQSDANKNLGPTRTRTEVFYVYPGNGSGLGARIDVGGAYDLGGLVLGVGMNNLLGFVTWQGTEEIRDENGGFVQRAASRSQAGLEPNLFVNAAVPVGPLLLGADWSVNTGAVHLGGEFSLGPIKLRAGVGYSSGLSTGIGAGFSIGGVNLDAALTTHTAPLVGGTVYGIALAFRY